MKPSNHYFNITQVICHISISFFCELPQCSSHGTVNSHFTIFFSLFKENIKSGCKYVFTMCSWNINLVITFSQSVEGDRMFGLGFAILLGFVPKLRNCISLFPGLNSFIQMTVQTMSAIAFKIGSCCHL